MKTLFFITILLTLTFSACTSNEGANAEERRVNYAEFIDEPTEITFTEVAYDFGTIEEGDMVKHTFTFTNTGESSLVLLAVNTSCGCTVPEDWPKSPIMPGETGQVKVIFNSDGKSGKINKSVRIEANTNPSVTTVNIIGEVKAAE